MIVVSDTSPLTYLHQIERLSLLRDLYRQVAIPPTVERELRGAAAIHKDFDWTLIKVVEPRDSEKVDALSADLDRGESEALVLALELKADLLLIDEASGREIATKMGIRRTGLLGVFLEGKRRGFIPTLSHELTRLVNETSFRISDNVRLEVLRIAGEL